MKIKYKAPLIVLAAAWILSLFAAYSNYYSSIRVIESAMQSQFVTVSNLISSEIQAEATRAASLAALISNLPEVEKFMRARDRDSLIKWIVPDLLLQHDRFEVEQVHFHVPPATSFLRLTRLEKWGDDLSGTREMVLKANKELTALQGIEVSSTGMNIRSIEVIKDEQGPIGTVEVEMSFSRVLDLVKQITGFEGAAFVDDALMSKIATLAPKPDPEKIISGYRNVDATDWDFIQPLVTPKLLRKINDITYKTFTLDGEYIGMVIVPLLDFKGAQIGYIIAVRHFTHYQTDMHADLVRSLAFGLLQAILLSGILLIVIKAFLLSPIEKIDKEFKKVFNGEKDVDVSQLTAQDDEIGSLAKYVDQAKAAVKLETDKMEKPHE